MLDVSIRVGILNMMAELREREGVSILYITHDLASARYVADRVIVMYAGHVVEIGPTEQLLAAPRHPYTQLLLSAVPDPRAPSTRPSSSDVGEPPKVVNPAPGCRFEPRCPFAIEQCRNVTPVLGEVAPVQLAACHVALVGRVQSTRQSPSASPQSPCQLTSRVGAASLSVIPRPLWSQARSPRRRAERFSPTASSSRHAPELLAEARWFRRVLESGTGWVATLVGEGRLAAIELRLGALSRASQATVHAPVSPTASRRSLPTGHCAEERS